MNSLSEASKETAKALNLFAREYKNVNNEKNKRDF